MNMQDSKEYKSYLKEEYRKQQDVKRRMEALERTHMFLADAASNSEERALNLKLAAQYHHDACEATGQMIMIHNKIYNSHNVDAMSYAAVYPVTDEYYLIKIRNGDTIKGYSV